MLCVTAANISARYVRDEMAGSVPGKNSSSSGNRSSVSDKSGVGSLRGCEIYGGSGTS